MAWSVADEEVVSPRFDRVLAGDAAVYAISALFAIWLTSTTSFVTFRSWATIAWPFYLTGLLTTLVLLLRWRPVRAPRRRALGQGLHSRRWIVLAAVTLGANLLPTVYAVSMRAQGNPDYVQSDVVLVEASAESLRSGEGPYLERFDSIELAGRVEGIHEHFPYLPGMAGFGVPRMLVGLPWGDARLTFLVVSCLLTVIASRRLGTDQGIRVSQILIVAPTGALLSASGSTDVAVLALCLCGLVLWSTGSRRGGLLLLVCAACVKQTAWPVLVALMLSLPPGRERGRLRVVLGVALGGVLFMAAFGRAAINDTVVYPLGFSDNESPVTSATLGALAFDLLPAGVPTWIQVSSAIVLLGIGVTAAEVVTRSVVLTSRWSPTGLMAVASVRYGAYMVALIALAPVARPGYLVYPVNAFLWAWVVRPAQYRDRQ